MLNRIDINADLGEGSPYDAILMPLISSCSIACGGHFGNEKTMRAAVQLAKKHKVKIGAHPSFPDMENFGRKVLPMTANELSESVFHQLNSFLSVCESEEVFVHHIKLHGALYNYAAIDAPTADAVLEGILATQMRSKLYVPYGSVLAKKAENLLPLEFETKQKSNKSIIASTFCIHSDTSNAVEILSYIRLKLKQLDIDLFK